MRANRAYVRRERPMGLIMMAALMALGTGLFVAFARPAINSAPAEAEKRQVNEITLAGESVYLVGLCSVSDVSQARVEAARYAPRGAAGYIFEQDGEYIVAGSGYEEEYEARSVAMNLSVGENIDAVAHVEAQDEVRLRVNSTETQLKAFTDADAMLRRASRALRECAVALDSSGLEPVEARSEIKTLGGELSAASNALYDAAGNSPNGIVKTWLDMLVSARDSCDSIAGGDYKTKLYLSSAVKHAFLDIRLGHIAALKGLA